jgi:uncharacterized protein YndB with AHSA1/START domain
MTSGETSVRIDEDIVLEVLVEASPETIFPFFIDPEQMVRWQGTEADLDPVPGGRYYVRLNEQAIGRGEFVEIDPPKRVVFTFGWEGEGMPVPPGSTTVAIDLIPQDTSTLVRLTHSGLPSDEMRHAHVDGWGKYMPRLKAVGEGRDPGPEPHAPTN